MSKQAEEFINTHATHETSEAELMQMYAEAYRMTDKNSDAPTCDVKEIEIRDLDKYKAFIEAMTEEIKYLYERIEAATEGIIFYETHAVGLSRPELQSDLRDRKKEIRFLNNILNALQLKP